MKKKLILSTFILMVVTLTVILLGQSNERVIYSSKINELPTTDALAMMYETESGSGEYVVSDDTSWPLEGYVFNAELSRCENGSKLYWNEETKSVMMEANVSDKCYVYFDKKPSTLASVCERGDNLAGCIAEFNTLAGDGAEGLYYHDGSGSYTNASEEAGDNSYRFAGENPNNYVCFGSKDDICSEDSLYRIIGVFDGKVKLIKASIASSDLLGTDGAYLGNSDYYWTTNISSNSWKLSILNTFNLNTYFISNFGSEFASKISNTTWHVGGLSSDIPTDESAKTVFDYEVGINSDSSSTYSNYIGLMYVSDYRYASAPRYWSGGTSENWLNIDAAEWTITRVNDSNEMVYYIRDNIGSTSGSYYYRFVRPTFYLNSNVALSGGTGTQSDPYTLAD